MTPFKIIAVLAACSLTTATAAAQEARSYSDGKRGDVILPLGDLSFADVVVSHVAGSGKIAASAADPMAALGAPGFSGNVNDGSFLSMGCDGSVVLQFTDNALVDVPGPDLYVFEVGPRVEGMSLDVSVDGQNWLGLGELEGGRSEVDIEGRAQPGVSYRFVRLTDDGKGCGTNFAGADIDAVAAIGSSLRYVLEGEVLFAHDSSELRDPARAALQALAADIAQAGVDRFEVVGHTDSSGSDAYNRALSEARALAVRDYMVGLPVLSGVQISAVGAGETEPVAPNDSDAGRRQNRRVEIIGSVGR